MISAHKIYLTKAPSDPSYPAYGIFQPFPSGIRNRLLMSNTSHLGMSFFASAFTEINTSPLRCCREPVFSRTFTSLYYCISVLLDITSHFLWPLLLLLVFINTTDNCRSFLQQCNMLIHIHFYLVVPSCALVRILSYVYCLLLIVDLYQTRLPPSLLCGNTKFSVLCLPIISSSFSSTKLNQPAVLQLVWCLNLKQCESVSTINLNE